jgi:uncharacterized protein (DUF3820 family)
MASRSQYPKASEFVTASSEGMSLDQLKNLQEIFQHYLQNPLDSPLTVQMTSKVDKQTQEIIFTWRAKMPIMEFGKYKGMDWKDVPEDYLKWLISRNEDQNKMLNMELQRREDIKNANDTVKQQIIKAGFAALAKKHHPDVGGDPRNMQAINAAYEALKEIK